jgi:hypothetical protein
MRATAPRGEQHVWFMRRVAMIVAAIVLAGWAVAEIVNALASP